MIDMIIISNRDYHFEKVEKQKSKMVDVVLIVTSVIFAALILLASVYFVVYFQHPEDKNVAWFPKIITVKSLMK
jgi:hypothetical protein